MVEAEPAEHDASHKEASKSQVGIIPTPSSPSSGSASKQEAPTVTYAVVQMDVAVDDPTVDESNNNTMDVDMDDTFKKTSKQTPTATAVESKINAAQLPGITSTSKDNDDGGSYFLWHCGSNEGDYNYDREYCDGCTDCN
jgi:hypothetical protein